ncbi:MAG: PepSY-associated TM helix domain-containing protein [Ferrovibrionaceae bacterium]
MRSVLVRLHRWFGLTAAVFLVATGLTGSVLTFQHELDALLNPRLFRSPGQGTTLDPLELARRVETAEPSLRVIGLPMTAATGDAVQMNVRPRLDPATGKPHRLGFDQVFVDPVDGRIVGTRAAREALIPTIYLFHYTLLDPTGIARVTLGIIAILWTFDCLAAWILTLPRRRSVAGWAQAWKIKAGGRGFRLAFDLHRAGALWLWLLLFLLALSSITMNLRLQVAVPVLSTMSTVTPSPFTRRGNDPARLATADATLSFAEIAARAAAEAEARGWNFAPGMIYHYPAYGLHAVRYWPSAIDRGSGLGRPILYFDDRDGGLFEADIPGIGTAADIFLDLQLPLHSGRIAGLPGRIAVCLAGIGIAVLTVTGVIIWWRKRPVRRRA